MLLAFAPFIAISLVDRLVGPVWALAFVVLVAADLVLLSLPETPPVIGIGATVLALVGVIKLTRWYPNRAQAAH